MKKIMFNEKYGLNQAVLDGRKTMTRRIIKGNFTSIKAYNVNYEWIYIAESEDGDSVELKPHYKIGEKVAIAQSYHSLNKSGYVAPEWCDHICEGSAGYENKMFVRADLMPHHIRITGLKFERLQSISEDDCLKEGIIKGDFKDFPQQMYFPYEGCKDTEVSWTAFGAFGVLIDKVSGKGTRDSNPWVVAYTFKLVD